MSVSSLDSIIGQSLGMTASSAGASSDTGNADSERSGNEAAAQAISSATVTLSNRTLPRTIVNSYEKVELSRRVPQQITATTMEASGMLSEKMMSGESLSKNEQKVLRENRVLAALTGMRILEKQTGEAEKIWMSGLPVPSEAEMQEAYKRLTQRLSSPTGTEQLLKQNADRVNLLEAFRSQDFSGFTSTTDTATVQEMAA